MLRIPAGSANIDIRQHGHNNKKDDDNYLALRGANGEFLLNGHFQVSVFRQQIPVFDSVLEYSGSDNVIERINGTGPFRSEFFVNFLSVGNLNLPNIHYKYMVPNQQKRAIGVGREVRGPNATIATKSYSWRFSQQWTDCSAKCQGVYSADSTIILILFSITYEH